MSILENQRNRLSVELQQHTLSSAQPFDLREPFLLTSCLQKALRRGDGDVANSAAQALLLVDATRVWRRFVTVIFEDFGLTDLTLTSAIVAAAANKRWRLEMGGDTRVASYFIEQMVSRPRDRRIDNLYMLAVRHVTHPASRRAFLVQQPSGTATNMVLRAERIVAECEQEVPYRSLRAVRASQCDAALDEMMASGIADDDLRTVCAQGRRSSMCLLPVLLPLVKRATDEVGVDAIVRVRAVPEVCQIEGIPSYALDGYTRVGKEALATLARSDGLVSKLLQRLRGQARSNALTYMLFEAEGGVCTNEASDLLYEELKQLAYGCWTGLPRDALPEAVAAMREAVPKLNAIRRSLFTHQHELFER